MVNNFFNLKKLNINFLIVFLTIFLSFTPLISNFFKLLITIILILLIIIFFPKISKQNNTLKIVAFIILFLFSIFLDFLRINTLSEFSLINFYFPITFLFGYFLSERISLKEFLIYTHKITIFFAILSFGAIIIYTFFPNIVFNLPIYINRNTIHRTAYFFNILTVDNFIVPRNAGFTWEPGAFQFLLNIGLFSYLRYNKRINFFILIVYILAIISTGSTTGILTLFINLIIIFLFLKKNNNKLIISAIVIFFLYFSLDLLAYHLNYKILTQFDDSSTRFIPLFNAFIYSYKNIFGVGNSFYDLYYEINNYGSFDSYSQIFIRYGYFLLLLILITLSRLKGHFIPLLFIILLTFSSLSLWFFPFLTPLYFFKFEDKTT
jgi:hypothetical protein